MNRLFLCFFLGGLVLILTSGTGKDKRGNSTKKYNLNAVLKDVEKGLNEAEFLLTDSEGGEEKKYHVKKVTIELAVSYDVKVSGEVKVIGKVKHEREFSKESKLKFFYEKPEAVAPENAELSALKKDKNSIMSLSNNIAKAVLIAEELYEKSIGLTGMNKIGYETEIAFGVSNVTAVGAEFEVFSIGGSAGIDYGKMAKHIVTVEFEPK